MFLSRAGQEPCHHGLFVVVVVIIIVFRVCLISFYRYVRAATANVLSGRVVV